MNETRKLVEIEITGAGQVVIKDLPVRVDNKIPVVTKYGITADVYMDKGDYLQISNQMRMFKLTGIYGKKAVFKKFNDKGRELESFYLIDGKKYLFAVTSGAARNGVAHLYREPKTDLERLFSSQGWSLRNIETVDEINHAVYDGGRWCHHMVDRSSKYWYYYETDGDHKCISEGSFVESSSNQYHVGCMETPHTYKVTGGTYLIELKDTPYRSYCSLYRTRDADEKTIINVIETLLKTINK